MKTNKLYKYIAVPLVLIFLGTNLLAQSRLEKARNHMDNYQFSNALAIYTEVYKNKTPKKDQDIRDIAHCYIMMNDIQSAQDWLSKINSFSIYTADDVLNYANALKSLGRYNDAIAQYNKYKDVFPEKSGNVPEWIQECVISQEWLDNPKTFNIENVESLNTENSDFGLIKYSEGYLFSSDRKLSNKEYKSGEIFGWTGNPYLKLYTFTGMNKENALGDIKSLENINTDHHNGPGAFDSNNNILYYTVTTLQKDKTKVPTNNDPTSWINYDDPDQYVNRLEIYSAKKIDDEWYTTTPFEHNNPKNYSVGHPTLSGDGKIIYFSSDMPGGFGKSDLYFCTLQDDGTWSEPVNAGSKINTDGKEGFPHIDKNGTLFYSSDGLPGMGGFDIFSAKGEKNNWDIPENIKYPINSPKDDFAIVFEDDNLSGYLSSNRDGGKGGDDIYYFEKELIIVGLTKERLDDNTIVPLPDVSIVIENSYNDNSEENSSDINGFFSKRSECGKAYEITGSIAGYFAQSKNIQTDCSPDEDTLYVEMIFEKMEENKTYLMENIYYDYNKWNIRNDAAFELDKLVKILKDNPEIDIELGSHTDSRGSNKYNENLSQKRAESAVQYIISKNIDSNRITAKGYGEYQLLNKCIDNVDCNEDDHQLNRRTEFKVTRIHNNLSRL